MLWSGQVESPRSGRGERVAPPRPQRVEPVRRAAACCASSSRATRATSTPSRRRLRPRAGVHRAPRDRTRRRSRRIAVIARAGGGIPTVNVDGPARSLNLLRRPHRYGLRMRVLILGAGFGGLELATSLDSALGERRRGDAGRPGRRLRLRVLQARRDVRPHRRRPRRCTGTPTSHRPGSGSCRPRCARSTRWPDASRPTPVRSTATSWSSPWAPTCTPRRRRGWSRPVTSSTPSPARSRPATCSTRFEGGDVSWR